MRLFVLIGVFSVTVTSAIVGYEVDHTEVDVYPGNRVRQEPPSTDINCYCKNNHCRGIDQFCRIASCYQVFNQLSMMISRGCSNERKLDGWEWRGRMLYYFCNENHCNDQIPGS